MLPTKFRFIWPSGFRGKYFQKSTNQKQLSVVAMFVNVSGRNEEFYSGPSIDTTYHVSVHFAKQFEKIFQKSTNQKLELPVAVMLVNGSGRNRQSLQRTFISMLLPSFGSFGRAVSEKIFRNRPIRKKNCLWRPCLLTDRDKMSNVYRGHSIDVSYQVSVHLA